MSKFSRFMKANKVERKNEFHAPTDTLMDENGNPLDWEFKPLTSKENAPLMFLSLASLTCTDLN